jgi:hypothetical protein
MCAPSRGPGQQTAAQANLGGAQGPSLWILRIRRREDLAALLPKMKPRDCAGSWGHEAIAEEHQKQLCKNTTDWKNKAEGIFAGYRK